MTSTVADTDCISGSEPLAVTRHWKSPASVSSALVICRLKSSAVLSPIIEYRSRLFGSMIFLSIEIGTLPLLVQAIEPALSETEQRRVIVCPMTTDTPVGSVINDCWDSAVGDEYEKSLIEKLSNKTNY